MRFFVDRFMDAISFFTRLGRAKANTEREWEASVFFFFPAACFLGALLLLPLFLIHFADLPQAYAPFIGGWLWLALEVWLSRGLHWDGLADLADALGSGKQGEAFWVVLHDSRLGSFGALALLLVLLGQWLCVSLLAARSAWFVVLLAPAWARLAPLWLCPGLVSHPASALGRFVVAAKAHYPLLLPLSYALFFLLPSLLAFLMLRPALLLLIPLESLLLLRLRKIAIAQGGVSGDFFGAAIELSQLLFLLVLTL